MHTCIHALVHTVILITPVNAYTMFRAIGFELVSHPFYCTGTAKTHIADSKLERNAHFCTDRRHLLCTGAAFLNFLHRRGVFL